jgi:hypothetical protein
MRPMLLLALGVTFLASGDKGAAQVGQLRGGINWAPNSARSVTISRGEVVLTTFVLPVGTFLSASYDDRQPNVISPGHFEFRGDFVLRAQPAADAPGQAPGRRFEEIMSRPPFVLTLRDVDVTIENVTP